MKAITVRFGVESITKQVADEATVGEIVALPFIKAGLGYGDNLLKTVAGTTVGDDVVPLGGATVTVATKANDKGR